MVNFAEDLRSVFHQYGSDVGVRICIDRKERSTCMLLRKPDQEGRGCCLAGFTLTGYSDCSTSFHGVLTSGPIMISF